MASLNTKFVVGKKRKGARSMYINIKGQKVGPGFGGDAQGVRPKCPFCFREFPGPRSLKVHCLFMHHKKYEEIQGPKQVST